MNLGRGPRKPLRLKKEPPVERHEIEALIIKARDAAAYLNDGKAKFRDVCQYLVDEGAGHDEAYLAAVAARIMDG